MSKDIINIEQVQSQITKYILNDYTTNYKSRMIQLQPLPIMYLFELQDIVFAITSLKYPTKNFNLKNWTL